MLPITYLASASNRKAWSIRWFDTLPSTSRTSWSSGPPWQQSLAKDPEKDTTVGRRPQSLQFPKPPLTILRFHWPLPSQLWMLSNECSECQGKSGTHWGQLCRTGRKKALFSVFTLRRWELRSAFTAFLYRRASSAYRIFSLGFPFLPTEDIISVRNNDRDEEKLKAKTDPYHLM